MRPVGTEETLTSPVGTEMEAGPTLKNSNGDGAQPALLHLMAVAGTAAVAVAVAGTAAVAVAVAGTAAGAVAVAVAEEEEVASHLSLQINNAQSTTSVV